MLVLCGWKNDYVHLSFTMVESASMANLRGDFRRHMLRETVKYEREISKGQKLLRQARDTAQLDKHANRMRFNYHFGAPGWAQPHNALLVSFLPEDPNGFGL